MNQWGKVGTRCFKLPSLVLTSKTWILMLLFDAWYVRYKPEWRLPSNNFGKPINSEPWLLWCQGSWATPSANANLESICGMLGKPKVHINRGNVYFPIWSMYGDLVVLGKCGEIYMDCLAVWVLINLLVHLGALQGSRSYTPFLSKWYNYSAD